MTRSEVARRVLRICESTGDARELRRGVLDEIRRVVAFDAYVWLLTDPETSVGTAPLADVPCVDELPRLVRLKYLTEVNRWTSLDTGTVARLHDATSGDLSRSRVWRELLVRHGVRDIASLVFRDGFGCWGFLDLWRCAPHEPFSDGEAAFLVEALRPVTGALRRCQARALGHPPDDLRRSDPVVLLLSPELGVMGQTPQTRDYLRQLLPPSDDRAPVPAAAYNVAAQLLAREAGVDDAPAFARVHLTGGRWLALRAARFGESGAPAGRDVAVTVQHVSAVEHLDLFTRAFALTPREGELLRLLASGLDTRELSDRMFLSEHTVQDHLKNIFAKTSVRSRRALLSAARGA